MKHIELMMLSGNTLSHYCRQNFPNPKAAVHGWTTENLCLDFIIPRKIKTKSNGSHIVCPAHGL